MHTASNRTIIPYTTTDRINIIQEHLLEAFKEEWKLKIQGTRYSKVKSEWEVWKHTVYKDKSLNTAALRLRTGHSRLCAHMRKIGFEEDEDCPYCHSPETVEHYLLYCFRHHNARTHLRETVTQNGGVFDTQHILGGGDLPQNKKQSIAKALGMYLRATKKATQL